MSQYLSTLGYSRHPHFKGYQNECVEKGIFHVWKKKTQKKWASKFFYRTSKFLFHLSCGQVEILLICQPLMFCTKSITSKSPCEYLCTYFLRCFIINILFQNQVGYGTFVHISRLCYSVSFWITSVTRKKADLSLCEHHTSKSDWWDKLVINPIQAGCSTVCMGSEVNYLFLISLSAVMQTDQNNVFQWKHYWNDKNMIH